MAGGTEVTSDSSGDSVWSAEPGEAPFASGGDSRMFRWDDCQECDGVGLVEGSGGDPVRVQCQRCQHEVCGRLVRRDETPPPPLPKSVLAASVLAAPELDVPAPLPDALYRHQKTKLRRGATTDTRAKNLAVARRRAAAKAARKARKARKKR